MKVINSSELRLLVATMLVVTLTALGTLFLSGCGGGNGPSAPAVQPIKPQSQPVLRPTDRLLEADDIVKPAGSSYLGDMDQDGDATIIDAMTILMFAVRLQQPTSMEHWLADVDGSGNIDIIDAMTVLAAAVRLSSWPLDWPSGNPGPPPPPFPPL